MPDADGKFGSPDVRALGADFGAPQTGSGGSPILGLTAAPTFLRLFILMTGWLHHPDFAMLSISIVSHASASVRNQWAFKLNFLFNASMNALSVGLPSREKTNVMWLA